MLKIFTKNNVFNYCILLVSFKAFFTIDLKRYAEVGLEGKSLKNIISGDEFVWGSEIELTEKGSIILTTKK